MKPMIIHSSRQLRIIVKGKQWRLWNVPTKPKSTMPRECAIIVTTSTEETVMLMLAHTLIDLSTQKVNVKIVTWMIITSKRDVLIRKNNKQLMPKIQVWYLRVIVWKLLSKILYNQKDKKLRIVMNNEVNVHRLD